MTLTKDRIIDSIYKNTDFMKSEAARTFQSLLEIVKQSLESGEDVLISGFENSVSKKRKRGKGGILKPERISCWTSGGSSPSNAPGC